jgi:hypothetical protein
MSPSVAVSVRIVCKCVCLYALQHFITVLTGAFSITLASNESRRNVGAYLLLRVGAAL